MIRLAPEQLYKRITDEGYKFITFYDGYVPNPKESKQYFHRIKDEDPNILRNKAQQVLNDYPYQYTIVAQKQLSGSSEPPVVFMVEGAQNSGNNLNGFAGNMQGRLAINENELRDKILKELRAEMELDFLKKTVQAQKEELEGWKNGSKKLGAVGTEILYGFLSRNPKFKQAMNGFEINQTPEKSASDVPEIQNPEAVKKALEQCLKFLGEDSFIKLAQKLEDNPANAQTLKSFL